MSDCIFCKIIAKEIPATLLYEDEEVLAFMDMGPLIKGHALVIPKTHYELITDMPDERVAKLHRTAKCIAEAQMNELGAGGVNILQNNGAVAGQVVPHVHIHIIPRFADDGHHWNWVPKKYDTLDEMAELAKKIRNHLS